MWFPNYSTAAQALLCLLPLLTAVEAVVQRPGGSARIVDGSAENIRGAPYLVSLRYKTDVAAQFEHRCAGTIYSSSVVLTTATCVIAIEVRSLLVVAGSSYRTQSDGYVHIVAAIVPHPDFNVWFMDNDLAIVRLAQPLIASRPAIIAAAPLSGSLPSAGDHCGLAGWGATSEATASEYSEIVRLASVRIIANEQCKQAYGEYRISEAMICAQGTASGLSGVADACLGDAGGPLICGTSLIGLVSWGNGCGREEYPGVYTNLTHFRDWIEEQATRVM